MEIVKREDLPEDYTEMMAAETHHDHEIVLVGDVIRWKENPIVNALLKELSLNFLCPLLGELGYGKNSEVYRKLYRDMGYSLSGYWEVFYWDWNNEDCAEYKQPKGIWCE